MNCRPYVTLMLVIFILAGCAGHQSESMPQPAIDLAPAFTLPDQNGEMMSLGMVLNRHRGALIAFYPKDDSKN